MRAGKFGRRGPEAILWICGWLLAGGLVAFATDPPGDGQEDGEAPYALPDMAIEMMVDPTWAEALSSYSDDLIEEYLPSGAVKLATRGRFHQLEVAHVGPDGQVHVTHSTAPPAGQRGEWPACRPVPAPVEVTRETR
jgi:hypothetical protein